MIEKITNESELPKKISEAYNFGKENANPLTYFDAIMEETASAKKHNLKKLYTTDKNNKKDKDDVPTDKKRRVFLMESISDLVKTLNGARALKQEDKNNIFVNKCAVL